MFKSAVKGAARCDYFSGRVRLKVRARAVFAAAYAVTAAESCYALNQYNINFFSLMIPSIDDTYVFVTWQYQQYLKELTIAKLPVLVISTPS